MHDDEHVALSDPGVLILILIVALAAIVAGLIIVESGLAAAIDEVITSWHG